MIMTNEFEAEISRISARLSSDMDNTLRYYLWPRTISIEQYYSLLKELVSHAVAYSNAYSDLLVKNVIQELGVNSND